MRFEITSSSSASASGLYQPFKMLIHPDRADSALDQPETDRERFDRLRTEWMQDTMFLSSTTDMVVHPAYLQIIAMGTTSVPFMLEDLRSGPNFWATALMAITHANPVRPDQEGDMQAIADAWIDWGTKNGY